MQSTLTARLIFLQMAWLLSSFSALAGPVDSLQQLLAQANHDSLRLGLQVELGFAQWDQQALPAAQRHFRQAMVFADRLRQPLDQGQSRRYLGMVWAAQARYDSALWYYRQADPFLAKAGDAQEWMKLKVDLGNAHYFLAGYRLAIQAYQEADSLARLVGGLDQERGVILGNLGTLLMEMELPQQALKYHRQAVALARTSGPIDRLGTALHNLGNAYNQLDSAEQAEDYFRQALTIADQGEIRRLQGYCHHSLASLYGHKGQPEKAVFHAQKAFGYATNPEEEVLYRARLGYYMGNQGKNPQAEQLLLEALAESEALGLVGHTLDIVGFLEEYYAQTGEMAEAYLLADRRRLLQDSIRSQEIEAQVRALELAYETKQKEQENLQLKAQNETQAARLSLQRLLLGGFLLLIGIGGMAFYYYQKSQQGKRELAEQKANLQAQQIQEMQKDQQLIATQAMVEGQEAERNRLAKDLHDGLGGLLSTLRLQLSQLREEEGRLREHPSMLHSQDLLDKASLELRRIAHNLMPQALMRFGLQTALEDFVGDINQSTKLDLDLQIYGLPIPLSPAHELTVYRIIQELVHNVLKHAHASEALVQVLRREGRLYVTVEDNGCGFDPANEAIWGQGLANLRSRAEYLQGKLEMDSRLGEGTNVYLEFDLKSTDHD